MVNTEQLLEFCKMYAVKDGLKKRRRGWACEMPGGTVKCSTSGMTCKEFSLQTRKLANELVSYHFDYDLMSDTFQKCALWYSSLLRYDRVVTIIESCAHTLICKLTNVMGDYRIPKRFCHVIEVPLDSLVGKIGVEVMIGREPLPMFLDFLEDQGLLSEEVCKIKGGCFA